MSHLGAALSFPLNYMWPGMSLAALWSLGANLVWNNAVYLVEQ
jgi:hypothetical protein